jgi:glucosamine 6-phosphate synthetase-like amidotransferase/phosphosugar isomerase protein
MCGIFGFITRHGDGPDLSLLKMIAVVTQQRGPHAFGLAWLTPTNRLATFKRPGAATDRLSDVDVCRGALAVVGHCRFATHGRPEDNGNNHPHRAGRGWLVHNGVVTNHERLARGYRLVRQTDCDSEVLGLLMARMPGSILRRAALTARASTGELALLGIWRNPARLLVVRGGKPLHFAETARGFYFASLPMGLPGNVLPVTDDYAGVLRFERGRLQLEAESIGYAEALWPDVRSGYRPPRGRDVGHVLRPAGTAGLTGQGR